jgi:Fur family peroxide stress response transcriptional regulator
MTEMMGTGQVYRRHGLRLTPQRLAVTRALAADPHGHPTADEIYTRVRAAQPTISLATVYKVLNELVALGELSRVELGDDRARFDTNTTGHAHLRCVECGAIADLAPDDCTVGLRSAAGYAVLEYIVIVDGRCPRCQRGGEEG